VTVEDANILGGLGERCGGNCRKTSVWVERLGIKDVFGESGTSQQIKAWYRLTPQEIKKAVRSLLKRKEHPGLRPGRKTPGDDRGRSPFPLRERRRWVDRNGKGKRKGTRMNRLAIITHFWEG